MESGPLTHPKVAYRPDIDGLRAVAVLLVLFNHVGIWRFPGGFVGVDVFFVISGYLISALLLKEIRAGKFSIGRFYERRFRRIMPALLLVLAFTIGLSYHFLFPNELKSVAETEIGAIFSVSNIVLLHQAGYFDPIGKLKPLLHTWSLGVEEQFYIVFPILLFALVRWSGRHLKAILLVLTAVLFAVACYWTGRNSQQAFFLAPLRAWEFLFGTLLAAKALPALNRAWARNIASALGLLLILRAGLYYRDTTPFPGWNALAPCLGALLIIAAGETGSSAVGKLLSWGPVRGIGLISYSLYLWHWPIQVFQTTENILVPDLSPSWKPKAAVILVSLVVATLSWRLIEQPFRTGKLRTSRVLLFSLNGALLAGLVFFSAEIIQHGGWQPILFPAQSAYTDFARASTSVEQMRWGTCYVDPDGFHGLFQPSVCLADDPTRKHVLLLGDSHSAHTYSGLQATFPELNISQVSVTACAPAIVHSPAQNGRCDLVSDYIFNDYLLHHHVDTVILLGRWVPWDVDHLQQTTDWIKQHGMQVVVIGPSIEFDAPLVRLIELAHREHDPLLLARHRVAEPQQLDGEMQALARDRWHVPYISIYRDLCNPATIGDAPSASGCPVYATPNVSLLWDTDHFSPAGALLFSQSIRAQHQLP